MIVLLIALFLICLYGIKFSNFHKDYLSHSQTGAIKGFFAIIIFLSHVRGYVATTSSVFDTSYNTVLNYIGQLMVTIFLFYSGYGIMESYKGKQNYVRGFLKNRVLKTLIHFDLAVFCFLIVSLFTKSSYSWKDYVFCWIGWTSIGNSNWFIFVILVLYIATFFAFIFAEKFFSQKKEMATAILIGVLSLVAWIILYLSGKESWWYNTLLCYPCGIFFSLFKDNMETSFLKSKTGCIWHYVVICGALLLFGGSYIFYYKVSFARSVTYSACACIFCLALVLTTTKIKIDNPILRWLGKHSFSIYILQRLPMIIFAEWGWSANKWIFVVLSFIATLLLSICFEWLYTGIDKLLIKSKEKNLVINLLQIKNSP